MIKNSSSSEGQVLDIIENLQTQSNSSKCKAVRKTPSKANSRNPRSTITKNSDSQGNVPLLQPFSQEIIKSPGISASQQFSHKGEKQTKYFFCPKQSKEVQEPNKSKALPFYNNNYCSTCAYDQVQQQSNYDEAVDSHQKLKLCIQIQKLSALLNQSSKKAIISFLQCPKEQVSLHLQISFFDQALQVLVVTFENIQSKSRFFCLLLQEDCFQLAYEYQSQQRLDIPADLQEARMMLNLVAHQRDDAFNAGQSCIKYITKQACIKQLEQNLIDLIESVNHQLQTLKLYALKNVWTKGLMQKVLFTISNWEAYGMHMQQQLILLTRRLQYNILNFTLNKNVSEHSLNRFAFVSKDPGLKDQKNHPTISLYEVIYPGITLLVTKLLNFFGMKPLYHFYYKDSNSGTPLKGSCSPLKHLKEKQEADRLIVNWLRLKKQPAVDKLIKSLAIVLTSEQTKLPKLTSKIDANGSSLYDLISQRQKATSNDISDFCSLLKILISQRNRTRTLNSQQIQNSLFVDKSTIYLQKIQQERLIEVRCIGCSTFFIKDANIQDKYASKIPIKLFKSVVTMKESQNQIKDKICSLLNSGGGAILFDCYVTDSNDLVVRGYDFTEKDKQQYQQRLLSYLDVFQPKAEVRRSIKVSFVPVAETKQSDGQSYYAGDEGLVKEGQTYRTRVFIKGKYVMRVIVYPISSTSIYFWRQNNNRQLEDRFINYSCAKLNNDLEEKIKMKNLSKQIKKRFKLHYLPQQHKDRLIALKPCTFFDHECKLPESGIPLNASEKQPEKILPDDLISNYDYASMIIVKSNLIPYLENAFREYGFECKIQVKFEKEGFTSAKHTAIMYHNRKFQEILQLVRSNPKFSFGGKPLLSISITNYLKLHLRNQNNPLLKEEFNNLVLWFNKQFPHQTIKCFRFNNNNNEIEYYVQTQSVESTLYCYYLLNHYLQKALFKNPLYLDKMDSVQKEKRFQLVYFSQPQKPQVDKHVLQPKQDQYFDQKYCEINQSYTRIPHPPDRQIT